MATEAREYVEEVRQIFKKYSSFDDRTEHNNAIKAQPQIKAIIRSVGAQLTQQSPFVEKQQALNAAIEVAAEILREGDRSLIGKDIREDLVYLPVSSSISDILDTLLPEELAALQADGEIPKAIHNLRWRAQGYSLDLGIDESVDRLWLEESDGEEDVEMTY